MGGGHSKLRNAFTLIELLAIIVILAIIAVITVPIILNVIDNAKKGSIKDSAYGYKDAIQKYYVQQLSINPNFKLNGNYTVDNGKLGEYEIPINGTKPTSRKLTYENNILKNGCLTFDDYAVNIVNGEVETVSKGACKALDAFPVAWTVDGVDYYEAPYIKTHPIYYNPISGSICTEEDYNNNTDKLGKTGCLKWYKYSGKDGMVNMILDHNTKHAIGWYSGDDKSYGPQTALTQLRTDTSGWTGVPVRNDSYTASWNNGTDDKTFTISYSGDRARLISAQEIANIVGNTAFDEHTATYNDTFHFGSLDKTRYYIQNDEQKARQRSYSWLFDNLYNCTANGCEVKDNDGYSHGYWTSSPEAGDLDSAFVVYTDGVLTVMDTPDTDLGVRPVITIPEI